MVGGHRTSRRLTHSLVGALIATVTFVASGTVALGKDFTFGSRGAASGQFDFITSIAAAPSGDVYVADRGNNRVQRFSGDGTFINSWSVPCVWGIAADATGVYAATTSLPSPTPGSCQDVIKYSLSGTHLWTNSTIQAPWYLASNGSTVFVSRLSHWGGTPGIVRLNPSTGFSAGSDWAAGGSRQPMAMAVLPENKLLYADNATGRAVVLNASGVATGAETDLPPNSYFIPAALAADTEGNVYSGWGNRSGSSFFPARVSVFSSSLAPVIEFEASLLSEEWAPNGMAVSPDSRIYMGFPEKGKIEVLDPKSPDPKLSYVPTSGGPSPEPCFVGDPLALRLTTSLRVGSVSEIAWDLDGNGSFEAATNASTATVTFDSMGPKIVRARVSTDLGKSAVAEFSTYAYPKPPGPDVGVSMNNGDQFTNNPNVTLNVVWPLGSTGGRVANDGGFGGARGFELTPKVAWKIASSGSERLPKTVYVRFQSAPGYPGADPTKTFQDDIILDQTAPTLSQATLGGSAKSSALAAKARSYKIKLRATDKTSGVAKAQVAADKRKPLKSQRYKSSITARLSTRPQWARVQDNAGNWSRWKKLK